MKKGVKIAIGAAVVVVAAAGIFSILGRKPEVVDDDVRPAVVAEKPQTGATGKSRTEATGGEDRLRARAPPRRLQNKSSA